MRASEGERKDGEAVAEERSVASCRHLTVFPILSSFAWPACDGDAWCAALWPTELPVYCEPQPGG